MKREMILFGTAAAMLALCAGMPCDAQAVGSPQLVTDGPDDMPVNEPKIATENQDRMVVPWNRQNRPGQGEVEVPVEVGYATWDPATQKWVEQGTLPSPGGSDRQASPFVTGVGMDEFVAGAISFTAQGEQTAYVVRMEGGSNQFASVQHFFTCEVDYPEIGIGPTTQDLGTRTVLLQQNLILDVPSGCGSVRQIAARDSEDEGQTWDPGVGDPHRPLGFFEGDPIFGFPSPPRIPDGDAFFSYSNLEGEFVRGVVDAGGDNTFGPLIDHPRNLSAAPFHSYFDIAKNHVAGEFEIGPFTSLAAPLPGSQFYVAYGDSKGTLAPDRNFNIYLVGAVFDGNEWIMDGPFQVNGGPDSASHDQFMPRMIWTEDGQNFVRLHVVWYDTRNDPQPASEPDVKLALFYAYSDDFGETWNEIELDDEAIDTSYLDNPFFIGDHIDIAQVGVSEDVIVTYVRTTHPRMGGGFGAQGGPTTPQENEAIYSVLIDF